ncbi:MAG: phosphosulfolactate synthase [Chloroflexi bacterium]|nr:phosphosulfolactate synthase [Chloroflexota bacterium]
METSQIAEMLGLPVRSHKPRRTGITHVLDKGLGMKAVDDLVETGSSYIDILKLGWGTSLVTPILREKIRRYQERGVAVCLGGTLLEVFISRNRFDEYVGWVRELGLTHVEVSDGVITLPHEEKLSYIRRLSKDFTVLSEIGSKDDRVIMPPYKWIEMAIAELEAGAWKLVGEARESGTAGIYRQSGEVRSGLIDEVVTKVGPENWIFEAPQKSQQVWFIRRFGPEVNLGNIATSEVLPLETLRLGLRADTLMPGHPPASGE